MLPSHVRVFWLLSVAMVACWALSTAWFVTVPSKYVIYAGGPPSSVSGRVTPSVPRHRADVIPAVISTSFWCVTFLGTAWLAAYRRQNWARWTFAGAFLAHGMQAGWIGALRDPGVEVHVMSAAATARVTRMDADEIARLADELPATSREIERFAAFGAIDVLFDVRNPDDPAPHDVAAIVHAIAVAIDDPRLGTRNPVERLAAPSAKATRALAREVRARIDAEWNP